MIHHLTYVEIMAKKRKFRQYDNGAEYQPDPSIKGIEDFTEPEVEGAHLYTNNDQIPWDLEP